MPKVKVELNHEVINGQPITFIAPCDSSEVTGLKVSWPGGTKEFTFKDSHGNDLTGIGELFLKGAYVRVIVDTENSNAFIQNADTNAYLEAQLASKRPNTWTPTPAEVGSLPAIEDSTHPGCYYRMVDGVQEWINPPFVRGEEYRTTERLDDLVVYTKLFDFGEMPCNSSKTVHNVVDGSIFYVDGIVFNADGVPFVSFATTSSVNVDFMINHVSVGSFYDFSNCTAYLIIKYLKM